MMKMDTILLKLFENWVRLPELNFCCDMHKIKFFNAKSGTRVMMQKPGIASTRLFSGEMEVNCIA